MSSQKSESGFFLLNSERKENSDLFHRYLNLAIQNQTNVQKELKQYTLDLLKAHWCDNLRSLIEKAVMRGYIGVEWIDFVVVGHAVNHKEVVRWAIQVIRRQKLDTILEPYFNRHTKRLGISLKRKRCQQYFRQKNMINGLEHCQAILPLEMLNWG